MARRSYNHPGIRSVIGERALRSAGSAVLAAQPYDDDVFDGADERQRCG